MSQGGYVRVLNGAQGGALVELQEWLRPGTKSSLKLSRPGEDATQKDRLVATGYIVRCWVDRLAPLRYRAAIVFGGQQGAKPPTRAESDLTVLLERPA